VERRIADRSLTPARIETLMNNARALPGTYAGGCGSGIADAARTLAALSASQGGLGD
jgi:serine protease